MGHENHEMLKGYPPQIPPGWFQRVTHGKHVDVLWPSDVNFQGPQEDVALAEFGESRNTPLQPFKTSCSSGWWYTYPSEKYEFVSWAYDIPNIWKK